MGSISGHPDVGHPEVADVIWMVPAFLVLLIVAGAIGGLLAGLPVSDVIGADGMAGTIPMVP